MSIYPKFDSSNVFNNNDIKSPEELNNNNNTDTEFDHSLYINRKGDYMIGELEIQTLKFTDNSIQSKAFTDEDETNINDNKDKLINISSSNTETIIPNITTDRIFLRDINGDQSLSSIDKIKIYENAGNIILNSNKLLNFNFVNNTTYLYNTRSLHLSKNNISYCDIGALAGGYDLYINSLNNNNIVLNPSTGYVQIWSEHLYIGNTLNGKIHIGGGIQNYAFTDNNKDQIETNKNNITINSNSINQNANDIIDNSSRILNIETNIISINELPISTDINNNFIINTPTIVDEIHIKFLYFDTHTEYQGQPFKNSQALQITLNKTNITNNSNQINTNTTNITNHTGLIINNQNSIATINTQLLAQSALIDSLILETTRLRAETNYLYQRIKYTSTAQYDDQPWYIIRAT